MDNEILSGKIRKKALTKMLLSIPALLLGILMLFLLYIGGLLSLKGYFQPYDVHSSIKEIDQITGDALTRGMINASFTATTDDMVDTGVYETENNKTVGYVVAAKAGNKYILCYLNSKDYEKVFSGNTYTFSGVFESIDTQVETMVLTDMIQQGIGRENAKLLLYKYELNTQSTGVVTRTLIYLLALIPWVFSIFLLIRGLGPFLNVYASPQVKELSKYGPVEALLTEIESQFTAMDENGKLTLWKRKSVVYLLDGWIVIESPLNFRFIKADEILWAYRLKQTMKTKGNIITSISYYAYFRSMDSMFSERGDYSNIENLLVAMAVKYPWMVVGYNCKLEEIWNTDIERFKTLVTETSVDAEKEGGEHTEDDAVNPAEQTQDTVPM